MNTSDKEARDENAVLSKKNAAAETTAGAEAVKSGQTAGAEVVKPKQTVEAEAVKSEQAAEAETVKPKQTAEAEAVKPEQAAEAARAEAVKAAENGGKQRNKIPEVAERLIGKMMTLLDTEAVSAQGIKSLTSALKDLKDLREGCGEGDGNGVLILPEIEIEPTKNAVDGESGGGGEGNGGEGNGGQGQNGGGE